ncbi:TetR family transcriptional regulator [Weissella oryzae SG25]|uniref:TetR family transcriptional regulator n=1 Tax=Weissella oryzae (strain DSM 25784 / JCM 18191 / LMG 30913 / SG25) TaxID=1329250 RepID=A0A069CQZ4_WEIOS|nr:TetR/AcrR family transcriptional regulator [Weissella oryzae]GAK30140.1 TetR family transcriptional regulator [Weissella oryzae SG25]
MGKRDLSKNKIIDATIELAKQIGIDKVSFPRLAEYFNIKAPSLYNHFSNMTQVRIETAIYLENILFDRLMNNLPGLRPTDALRKYAEIYEIFANEYSAVYELLNIVPRVDNKELSAVNHDIFNFINQIISNFKLDDDEVVHSSRMFRSMLHGYITMRQLGYFTTREQLPNDSFNWMVEKFILSLQAHE